MGLPHNIYFTLEEVRQIATRVAMRRGIDYDPMLIADVEDVIADVLISIAMRRGTETK
tara:strand:+ start:223 stop:396 length:174 start_codon:yes stop_codon:yes gene_type:complete